MQKSDVKKWVKFRWIVEQLFDKKSVGLNISYKKGNLAIYELHHRGKKTARWKNMRYKPFEEILDWIYSDDIVLLTGNNHELIKAVLFLKYIDFILPKFSSQIIKKARLIYKNINAYIHKKIESFPF